MRLIRWKEDFNERNRKLVLKIQAGYYQYLLSVTHNPSLSEDLLSETFVRAIYSIANFKKDSSVKTWLFSIARHVWLQNLRKNKLTVEYSDLLELYVEDSTVDIIVTKQLENRIIVSDHLESCESCRLEFKNYTLPMQTDINDKKLMSSIRKKLLFTVSALLLIGGSIGMVLNNSVSSNLVPTIFIILSIVFIGILFFKVDLKGDDGMNRFFMGKAIGSIIIFALLDCIYCLNMYCIFFKLKAIRTFQLPVNWK